MGNEGKDEMMGAVQEYREVLDKMRARYEGDERKGEEEREVIGLEGKDKLMGAV